MLRDEAVRSITAMAQSICHLEQWCNEVGAIGLVGPSFSPASSYKRSASQLLGFVQHVDKFLRRIIRNPSFVDVRKQKWSAILFKVLQAIPDAFLRSRGYYLVYDVERQKTHSLEFQTICISSDSFSSLGKRCSKPLLWQW
ncbi:hypothetical protein TNCV_719731 [Trichonephila clavipes]|nr:hypothetical protein TNCV_719731 [Trichonephila clavipes]